MVILLVTFVNEKATRGASVRGVSSTAAIFRDWLFVVTRGDQQKGRVGYCIRQLALCCDN